MERTLIGDLGASIGKKVMVSGWVSVRRDHGKLIFLVLRDRTGIVQAVVHASQADAFAALSPVKSEWVVSLEGTVQERPEKMRKEEQNGHLELSIEGATVLTEAQSLPFEHDAELNLDTYFDHLPLTLRRNRAHDIFTMAATIVQEYRNALIRRGFTEFQAPALVGGDAEGGAAVFKVGYYHDQTAYLATSPQLYKQIMVGAFERAFTIAKIFRAEKSATTRHLAELTQMDFEMGFVKDHHDVLEVLEGVVRDVVTAATQKHADMFARFGTTAPLIPEGKFPTLTLSEAQAILEDECGVKACGEPDMEPEHERKICEWAKEKHGSDFVFITAYPTAKRAFYTYEEPSEAPFSRGFDLLFRGLEINSGAQRIHNYTELVERIKSRGLDPEKFSFYLEAFKYGMPPHGGCSTGLERFTARMLELANVKEASPFPRDMTRIDTRLSEGQ
jgi:nondiscriminating aspartyl-tRNA synthetase